MFQIFVDSAANLPAVIAKKYNINVISFVNLISGKEVTCYNPNLTPEEEREKGKEYYDAMRKGCEIKTGLISTATFEEKFQEALDADQDVLYFSLSKISVGILILQDWQLKNYPVITQMDIKSD